MVSVDWLQWIVKVVPSEWSGNKNPAAKLGITKVRVQGLGLMSGCPSALAIFGASSYS